MEKLKNIYHIFNDSSYCVGPSSLKLLGYHLEGSHRDLCHIKSFKVDQPLWSYNTMSFQNEVPRGTLGFLRPFQSHKAFFRGNGLWGF